MSETESKLVLIVDDDESARRLLEIILEREGYQVALAESGEEALEMAVELRPALIVLDDMLPGIWGDEVYERLKTKPEMQSVKVVMHTGRMDKLAEYRRREDIAGVIAKPSPHNIILETIAKCFA